MRQLDGTSHVEPLYVALSADVDPDANRAAPGRTDAVSAGSDRAEYDVCTRGLHFLLAELEQRNLPLTLFWEARALEHVAERAPGLMVRLECNPLLEHGCHGYRHEDFAGADSGVPLEAARIRDLLRAAGRTIAQCFGAAPRGFRAPYCRLTPELKTVLSEFGYAYDASLTREPSAEWPLKPLLLDGAPGMWELALCRWRDAEGRPISGYLWQLFEGRRPVDDYLHVLNALRGPCAGGLCQIALHPWHIFVSADGHPTAGGPKRLSELLEHVTGMPGLCPVTVGGYLAAHRPAGGTP